MNLISNKAIQIFQNLMPILIDKKMNQIEREAIGSFSPEEAPNVLIPCTLSAVLYEVYPGI